MIRVEKIGNTWDVQVRDDDLKKEFALVAAVVMKKLTLEETLDLVRKAAGHVEDYIETNDRQSKIFQRRFAHLMELNSFCLDDMARAWRIPDEDVVDIRQGAIPSTETLRKLAQIFHVDVRYFFGVENETD